MNNRPLLVIILLVLTEMLLGASGGTGCAQAQGVSYSGSLQFATGSYFFEESTESFSLVNGLTWSGDPATVSFSLPFIVQNSPWISYSATGYLPTGGPQHGGLRDSTGRRPGRGGRTGMMKSTAGMDYQAQIGNQDEPIPLPDTASFTQSSFGDPNIYVNLKLFTSGAGSTSIQLNSGLKFPLADPNSGFGTGKWDYGLGGSVSQRIGRFFLIADLMKWWFGDLPDLELKDPLTYSLGIGRSLAGGSWMVNASFSGYTEIIEDYDPPMNLGFGIGYFASERVSLNTTASFGLSESSSDLAVGFGWNIRL